MAVAALVFGILGVYPLTFIGSIVAVILGTNAKKKIERNPEKYKGEGIATAAQVLAIVMLSLLGLILFFLLLAIMIGAFI
jgi:hypothetical protein